VQRAPLRSVAAAAFAAALVAALAALWVFAPGFGGTDDFQYLRAAQRWVTEGVYPATDHWQARLPYILSLAAILLLPLPPDPALYAVNMLGYCAMVVSVTVMAYRALGRSAAAWTGLIAAVTPLFLRRAIVLYPEMMEAGLAVGSLALAWVTVTGGGRRVWRLIGAGALAGIAFAIRQTALAVPAGFCGWLLIRHRRDPAFVLSIVVPYAAGALAVLFGEALFYLLLTGDPLWRIKVDLGHVLVPSTHLEGLVYRDGLPLFNADLASRWRIPSLLQLHWTIEGLGRLLTAPAIAPVLMLSLVGLGLGFWKGAQDGSRDIFWIALLTLLSQWILNTFVMSLAPQARYYTNAAAVMTLPAGFLLSRLPLLLRSVAPALLLVYLIAITALEPYYASLSARVQQVRAWAEEAQHFLGGDMPKYTLLLRMNESELALRLPVGQPPVGGMMITDVFPDPAQLEHRCEDGRERWTLIDTFVPQTPVGQLVRRLELDKVLNEGVIRHLERSAYRAYRLRRNC
jgi:hypothetical protein